MGYEVVQLHKETDKETIVSAGHPTRKQAMVAWIIWQPSNTWKSKYVYFVRKTKKQ